MIKFKLPALFLSIAMLAACGQSGSEYVGKWVSTKNEKNTMVIDRNGDGFMVRISETSFLTGKPRNRNFPATLEDGLLHFSVGMGEVTLAVDEATGHLTGGNADYKKQDE
ncbi:hypothetical protein D6851_14245 [Altericroceibacterium spongiae]|uniref:DUF2147 domain-containing protein n=1 Tax=Altericroceibacterium spongiae TaxID=2320269 RepID=A0A420EE44_9SPHN|nr:hypothetical protein [Altericroceibacterium spongiae]RKF18951.1 hypothetical protein D6851_14245 [Altericroceibacterium spongiae]